MSSADSQQLMREREISVQRRTTSIEVPIANKEGKHLKLTLDHETRQVEVTLPAMLKTPRVDATTLARAAEELRDALKAGGS